MSVSRNIAHGVSCVKFIEECLRCRPLPGSSVIVVNHRIDVLLDRLVYAAFKQANSIEDPGLARRVSKRLLGLANSELGFPDTIVDVTLYCITTLA